MAELIFSEEHVKELADHEARIEHIEKKVDDLFEIKENIQLLTYIQKEQNLFNKEQARVNAEVSNTLVAINSNLKDMSKKLNETDQKVENLQQKFEEVECKNKIDVRDIKKEEVKSKLTPTQKILIGSGSGAAIILGLIKVIESLITLLSK